MSETTSIFFPSHKKRCCSLQVREASSKHDPDGHFFGSNRDDNSLAPVNRFRFAALRTTKEAGLAKKSSDSAPQTYLEGHDNAKSVLLKENVCLANCKMNLLVIKFEERLASRQSRPCPLQRDLVRRAALAVEIGQLTVAAAPPPSTTKPGGRRWRRRRNPKRRRSTDWCTR